MAERSDPTQHAKGRTCDCLGPRKETATQRNVTKGGGCQPAAKTPFPPLLALLLPFIKRFAPFLGCSSQSRAWWRMRTQMAKARAAQRSTSAPRQSNSSAKKDPMNPFHNCMRFAIFALFLRRSDQCYFACWQRVGRGLHVPSAPHLFHDSRLCMALESRDSQQFLLPTLALFG